MQPGPGETQQGTAGLLLCTAAFPHWICALFQFPVFWGEIGAGMHWDRLSVKASALWKREVPKASANCRWCCHTTPGTDKKVPFSLYSGEPPGQKAQHTLVVSGMSTTPSSHKPFTYERRSWLHQSILEDKSTWPRLMEMHQGNWWLLRFCQLMGRCSGSAHSRFSSFPELLIILFSLLPWHPLLGGQLMLIKALYWINDLQPPVSVSKPPIFSSFKYLHNKELKTFNTWFPEQTFFAFNFSGTAPSLLDNTSRSQLNERILSQR